MTFWDKNKTLLKYKTVSDFTSGYLIIEARNVLSSNPLCW